MIEGHGVLTRDPLSLYTVGTLDPRLVLERSVWKRCQCEVLLYPMAYRQTVTING